MSAIYLNVIYEKNNSFGCIGCPYIISFFSMPTKVESIVIYFANVTNTSLTVATILVLIIMAIEFKIALIIVKYSLNKRRNKK